MNIDLYITFLHNYLNNIKFDTDFIIIDNIDEIIPNSVSHLIIRDNFNQVLKEGIYQIMLLVLLLDGVLIKV